MEIVAIIPNRNLLTTLKGTIDFLLKDSRVKIVIYDQDSTYPPLLEYYKSLPEKVGIIYSNDNNGPHSVWDNALADYRTNYYIITDPDCSYEGVPDDWLDKLLEVLTKTRIPKVGFSLRTNDLPNNDFAQEAKGWEEQFSRDKNEYGWIAHIDTTFALYRPYSSFTLEAIRLDEPYCIKHTPWYLTNENIDEEWKYYIKNASNKSFWCTKLKKYYD